MSQSPHDTIPHPAARAPGQFTGARAAELLDQATAHDRAGSLDQAIVAYEGCIAVAEGSGEAEVLATALRLLAVALHRRSDGQAARALGHRSHDVARAAGASLLVAQALNTLAAFDLADGAIESARDALMGALSSGGADDVLQGRIRQNLGIVASIQGELAQAQVHYQEALAAFSRGGDERGCAMAYNSLGMLAADRREWDEAEACFGRSLELTSRLGDVYLQGLALLSTTEVYLARAAFEDALRMAGDALRIFDQLGIGRHKADAYRVIGVVYRRTGRIALAEARLVTSLQLAQEAGALLEEAESTRELALVYRELGRNQDALRLLNRSQRLFRQLDARRDLVDVASRLDDLESTFMAVVRDWGQSIESSDSYTHGHCERVALYSVAVARQLGFDEHEVTTIRLGAYLHDLGKIRVPHEILNKTGRLTAEEFEIMKRHPMDGVEMLANIEFPWDIKPMIRWHHEKHCGHGYPDGLVGEEIPINAQIICIADVFDALTTTRSYRAAMSREVALGILHKDRHWWRDDVFEAFMRAIEEIPATD